MSRTRRSVTTEYKVQAAHRVIDSGRTIAEVARELGVNEGLLGRWVADARRRVEAAAARNDEPLTVAERTELARLRKQVAEEEKAIAACSTPTFAAADTHADQRRGHRPQPRIARRADAADLLGVRRLGVDMADRRLEQPPPGSRGDHVATTAPVNDTRLPLTA